MHRGRLCCLLVPPPLLFGFRRSTTFGFWPLIININIKERKIIQKEKDKKPRVCTLINCVEGVKLLSAVLPGMSLLWRGVEEHNGIYVGSSVKIRD